MLPVELQRTIAEREPSAAAQLLFSALAEHRQTTGGNHATLQQIAELLQKHQVGEACTVWNTDGDKFHSYPELYQLLDNLLGCRQHYLPKCGHCEHLIP